MGQFDQAIACWHRVELIKPNDKEPGKMVFQLMQDKLHWASTPHESTSNVAPVASVPAEEKSEEPKEVTLRPRQRLELAIAEDPSNVELYIELSQLLIDEQRWNEAEHVLQRCLTACGDAPTLRAQLERLRQLRSEKQQHDINARQSTEEPSTPLPWLEVMLACAGVALVLQIAPGLMTGIPKFITANRRSLFLLGNILIAITLWFLRSWYQNAGQQSES